MMVVEKTQVVSSTIDVVKRDGRHLSFEPEKIYEALRKASDELSHISPVQDVKLAHLTEKIVATIFNRFNKNVQIYEIQNIVEHVLLDANEYQLAEVYINYRTRRDFARAQATDINFTIDKLINKDQSVVNENANKDSGNTGWGRLRRYLRPRTLPLP